MIAARVPTRAEATDVAAAVYDGADTVMLSGESAAGKHPVEAVLMMDCIITCTESDALYHDAIQASHTAPRAESADAIGYAVRHVAGLLRVSAVVTYPGSGYSALRTARERPEVPILGMTPRVGTARRLFLAWGVHAVLSNEVVDGGVRRVQGPRHEEKAKKLGPKIHEKLVHLGRNPKLVRTFFRHPSVRYIYES